MVDIKIFDDIIIESFSMEIQTEYTFRKLH